MTAARAAGVRAAGWGWRHAGRRAWAVRELDLDIAPGERVLLLGASGSGKSTLLAALAGVLGGADEGEERGALLVDGRRPEEQRGRIGLVLQDPDAQQVLARVGDDVAFGLENLGVPRDELWRRVQDALDAVGLAVPLRRSSAELSGGQKQRLALAGVIAMRPGLLLLDEPTANLDPHGVAEVREAVERVADDTGATVLVVEHRVEVWQDFATRVIVLGGDGELQADGDPARVLVERADELAAAGVWLPGRRVLDEPSQRPVGAPLLTAHALAVGHGRTPVASGLSLTLGAGEAVVVTGPNGSGKSTTALTLGGLLRPLGGEVAAAPALAGDAGPAPIAWSSRQLLTRIGSVFQNPEHQLLAASVRGELAVGPRALGLPDAEVASRVEELLARLRLDPLADANPYTLSGGQKRRLTVGTALATRPQLLLLDEPTFGQDAVTWAELVLLLRELADAGDAILAVSHDPELARALGAREWPLAAREAAAR
ncbi:ABC transporter ATP-binding protein [Gryllotalpicola ginsengisoli]|uniref:ABC transporter ATP-binding protein n=1 Tax=Gryllotalpicola ginsengisoli TaxID=444608 RepID=UPI0003B32FBA|nr:ATP-binding cassette domain-containing protein [Gryllotalpicola ginsengisoli]